MHTWGMCSMVYSTPESSGALPSGENLTFPPSIEALMSDLSMFEEPPLENPDEEMVSSLGVVYEVEAIKGVLELLKDATPFKMVASISVFLIFYFLVTFLYLLY